MDSAGENLKTWSLKEANEAIPVVTRVFDSIFALDEAIESLGKDIAVLQDIWGAGLLEPKNPDYAHYKGLRIKRAALQCKIDFAIAELRRMGLSIDDIKHGVVHFYHRTRRGSIVAFCWRYGEQRIGHWHELAFNASRKPIEPFGKF